MKLALLCWYISAVTGVLVGASFASMLGKNGEDVPILPLVTVYAAIGLFGLLVFGLGLVLYRLPPKHWVHRSVPVWGALLTTAFLITVLAAGPMVSLVVIGG